ncbi:hypothetical protein [Pseudaestuariivita rosea]|uniref:hypothetical protein n=1 Tax=Pseudaestuariivita rosea TaxID=2763263 RepID=UPI001ABAD741|nr:hypothetical protein [Pseudaestuariivita rosea]
MTSLHSYSMGDWPSLAPHRAVQRQLFGDKASLLDDWYAEQVSRVDDPGFARLFSDHIDLEGVVSADYNHRFVKTAHGAMLGGIRFYGQDISRPFVRVIAHSFDDLAALARVVAAEWSMFRPDLMALVVGPGEMPHKRALVDVTVHAARYGAMQPADGRVQLKPFEAAEDAIDMIAARYRYLAQSNPALARNVEPADEEDVRDWFNDGTLYAVHAADLADKPIGLIAVQDGAIDWIVGDEVGEEVVMPEHAGRGFAASAQRALAAMQPKDRLMIGTIDGLNHASRISAERAGRPEVLRHIFVPL